MNTPPANPDQSLAPLETETQETSPKEETPPRRHANPDGANDYEDVGFGD